MPVLPSGEILWCVCLLWSTTLENFYPAPLCWAIYHHDYKKKDYVSCQIGFSSTMTDLLVFYHNYFEKKIIAVCLIVSPVRSTYGGYYGLVVVTPPPRPQTLHRSQYNLKKSLSDCFHILYVDWIAQNANFVTLGPIYEKLVIICFPCYKFVCSVMRS